MNRLKLLMFGMLAFVGVAAFILTYAGLYQLAILAGYSTGVAWLVPFCVDAGAIAALLAGKTGFAPYKPALMTAFGLMAGSVLLNVMQHLVAAGHLPHGWWLTVVVSAIPAIVVGLIAHTVVQGSQERRPATIRATAARVVDDMDDAGDDLQERPRKSIAERPRDNHGRFVAATDAERLEQIRELASTNGHAEVTR